MVTSSNLCSCCWCEISKPTVSPKKKFFNIFSKEENLPILLFLHFLFPPHLTLRHRQRFFSAKNDSRNATKVFYVNLNERNAKVHFSAETKKSYCLARNKWFQIKRKLKLLRKKKEACFKKWPPMPFSFSKRATLKEQTKHVRWKMSPINLMMSTKRSQKNFFNDRKVDQREKMFKEGSVGLFQ